MKAVVFHKYGSPDVLHFAELEKPIPRDNEVLVRVFATTVTAVDSIFRKGNNFFARLYTGLIKPRKHVLGTELAGEIEAVGKDVTLLKKGDPVFGTTSDGGTHTEYVCMPAEDTLTTKPSNMTYEEAAAVPYGTLTALPFLRDSGRIQSGQKVLIIGASGSIGTFAVQLAKYFGADVTGVCSTANVELVKSLGAHRAIDYTKEDFTKSGKTYHIIFDTVGKSSFSRCKSSLTQKGIFLSPALDLPIMFHMLWTSKIGSKKAIFLATGLRPASEQIKDLSLLKEMIEAGKIRSVIDRRYPLEQIAEAHAYVDTGHKKGNVVITLEHPDKT